MFRFLLRDLFWLIALVAVALAWHADHRAFAGQRAATRAHAEKLRSSLDAADGINRMLRYSMEHPNEALCWQVPQPDLNLIKQTIP